MTNNALIKKILEKVIIPIQGENGNLKVRHILYIEQCEITEPRYINE